MTAELTPLPGDPSALKSKADALSESALQIEKAISQLRRLSDRDETVSEAIDQVRGKASDIADNITKAKIRYAGTAEALQEYAPKLEAAQERAAKAISAYATAQQQVSTATASLQSQSEQYAHDQATAAAKNPNPTGDRPTPFGSTSAGSAAHHAVTDANAAVQSALDEYHAAVHEVQTAAQHAISKIKDAIDDSGLNDGFWDKIKHAVGSALEDAYEWAKKNLAPIFDVIQQIADTLSNIVGWIAMAVNILAVFLPILAPLAAALDILTLALALISFTMTLALLAFGDRTWGDLLSTGINVVLSAMPIKGAGKQLAESAEKITNVGVREFSENMSRRMIGFGDKAYMKGLSNVDAAISGKLDKIGEFVGRKGEALAGTVGKKVTGYVGGSTAAVKALAGSLDHGTGLDRAMENAATQYAHKSAHAVAAASTTIAHAAGKAGEVAEKVTGEVVDHIKDGLTDAVVSNGTNALDHYVFHQQDHHSSGLETSAPSSAPTFEFVSKEDGLESPQLTPGMFSPLQNDWSKIPLHSAGAETATVGG